MFRINFKDELFLKLIVDKENKICSYGIDQVFFVNLLQIVLRVYSKKKFSIKT